MDAVMDDATQKLIDEAPAWLDRHGDVWVFRNGMGWSFETRPFTREHIEKKWGPLVPLVAAQRPPVSPEVLPTPEAVATDAMTGLALGAPVDPEFAHELIAAAIEADRERRLPPVSPESVYDEEAIARFLAELPSGYVTDDGQEVPILSGLPAWNPPIPEYIAAALVAALRGGELTREETNRG